LKLPVLAKFGGKMFFTLLAILFIGLKLAGVIYWPWWLVLLPLAWPASVVVGVLIVVILREILD